MSKLTECPDCDSMVSTSAKLCPKCGRRLRREPMGCFEGGCLLLLLPVVVIGFMVAAQLRKGPATSRVEAPRKVAAPKVPGLDRLTIQDRMNIYREESEAGIAASKLADRAHDLNAISFSPDAARLTEERHAIYEQAKTGEVNRIKDKYGIREDVLQAIVAEGVRKGWPGP